LSLGATSAGGPLFPNRMAEVERPLASLLASVAHFVHPSVVDAVRAANAPYAADFAAYAPPSVRRGDYLFAGSDCGFPGVRRQSGQGAVPSERRTFVHSQGAILDDNVFPRHLWVFLARGSAYSGPAWKAASLDGFELAHLFPHKVDEVASVRGLWSSFPGDGRVNALFTSASAVVLVPKGLAKPTDTRGSVLACFYRRYLDLYGQPPVPGAEAADLVVPSWYSEIVWNEPVEPPRWRERTGAFLAYRDQRLRGVFQRSSAGSS
jgi:hypothetical protein